MLSIVEILQQIPADFVRATSEVITALGNSFNEFCKTISGQSHREKQQQLQISHNRSIQRINTAHAEAMQRLENERNFYANNAIVEREVNSARERINQEKLRVIDNIQNTLRYLIDQAICYNVPIEVRFSASDATGMSLSITTLHNPNFSRPSISDNNHEPHVSFSHVGFCLYWEREGNNRHEPEEIYITGIPSWNESFRLQRSNDDRSNVYSYNLACQITTPVNFAFKYKIKYTGENNAQWFPEGDPGVTNLSFTVYPSQHHAFIAYRVINQNSTIHVRHNAHNEEWHNTPLHRNPHNKTLHTHTLTNTTRNFYFRFFKSVPGNTNEQWHPSDRVSGMSIQNNLHMEATSAPSQPIRLMTQ